MERLVRHIQLVAEVLARYTFGLEDVGLVGGVGRIERRSSRRDWLWSRRMWSTG